MPIRLHRRQLLASLLATPLAARWSWAAADARDCHARVRQGALRGLCLDGVDTYKGVPYAGSVSGERRFLAAPPPPAWHGVRDATRLGPPSIQQPGGTYGRDEHAQSEDCLVLNIWSPQGGAAHKPVMVYSHGGGFEAGSGGSVMADGANLARENDVVVVATNHRLGILGFLYLDHLGGDEYAGSGNRGVQDIASALRWVHENIHAFRGDPGNVTIFGESGGGMKTACLYASPAAAPLFHKASIESGPGIRLPEPALAIETTDLLLHQLGIARADWRELLRVPTARFLEAARALRGPLNSAPPAWGGRAGLLDNRPGSFGPVHDGHVLPEHPFFPAAAAISRDKPLMVGGNRDEQMFFAMVGHDAAAWSLDEAALLARMRAGYGERAQAVIDCYRADRPGATPSDIYFAVQSDGFSGQGSTVIAERKAAQGGAPVYRYQFAFEQGEPVEGTSARMGAMHALDIPFKFDNVPASDAAPTHMAGQRPERHAMGRTMARLWANFARHGAPSAEGSPAWPAYDLRTRATYVIDAPCHVEQDLHRAEREFWEAV
ncbi:MAG: hypothetical protein RL684_1138 [Pseudomonadota bacterium]